MGKDNYRNVETNPEAGEAGKRERSLVCGPFKEEGLDYGHLTGGSRQISCTEGKRSTWFCLSKGRRKLNSLEKQRAERTEISNQKKKMRKK